MIEFLENLTREKTIILINAVILIAVLDILSPLFSYIIVKLFNWKKTKKQIQENPFYIPIKAFFKTLGIYIAIIYIQPTFAISQKAMDIITKIFKMVIIINTAIALGNSVTKKSRFINKIKDKSEKEIDDATTKLIVRVIKALIYIIAGFMVIADLGYDLSGLITGLGLGSVVITLAAQDTIKNLLGGIMIYIDHPFKVGEYIKFDTYEGTVEDITFRSTKLRTPENTIAQIPNSEISSATVVNFSKMKKRRYLITLGLVLDTDLNKIADLKGKILELLNNNEHVIEQSAHVFFEEIGANEFKVKAFCYVDTVNYFDFIELKEQLNFGIMNIINENKIELAYDTKTIEIKK